MSAVATEQAIRSVVEEVLAKIGQSNGVATGSANASSNGNANGARRRASSNYGVFNDVDQAVAAATAAFEALKSLSLEKRDRAVQIVKDMCYEQAEELGVAELAETKIGRLDHKIEKLQIIRDVPGREFMRSDAVSGDNGLTVTEYAPFGVIGAITPVTHSLPTLACNFVNMVAAGNTLVVNPHPSGAKIACEGVRRFNKAIFEELGIENLCTIIENPTIESADEIFKHRDVKLLCVTGGPAVARAALASNKRAIVAGPGNPPVVVDETADIENAAKCIIAGAAYDNNLLCIGEKEVFAVESIFDDLMVAMARNGAYHLNVAQIDALTKKAFSPPKDGSGHWMLNRDLVGKDAAVLAQAIGLTVPPGTELLYGETDESNPFVFEEQMMPFVPFVRSKCSDHAIEQAKKHEHGFRHTAIIHSKNVSTLTKMGLAMETTLFVKNGPCGAGLGLGGEGYLSFSIATPTGEGVTNPLTFTRYRRCVLANDLRII